MVKKRLLGMLCAATCLLATTATSYADNCTFTLGLQALHDAIPNVVGACAENPTYEANGDAQQHTTNGLLVWRKADNLTAFTDGFRSWLQGPSGVQQRLNTERFSWEAQSSVAGVSVSRIIDANNLVLHPNDTEVPPNFVLSDQNGNGTGGFSLTLRSYYAPDQSITTTVLPEDSATTAVNVMNDIGSRYKISNQVLGQLGKGFQNDGSAGVGDQSLLLQAKNGFEIFWTKGSYLLELDDFTGEGFGEAIVRARDVESKLVGQLSA